jgi:hypothetical protein
MGRLMLLMIFRLIIYKKMVVLCVVKLCTESAFDSWLSSVVVITMTSYRFCCDDILKEIETYLSDKRIRYMKIQHPVVNVMLLFY